MVHGRFDHDRTGCVMGGESMAMPGRGVAVYYTRYPIPPASLCSPAWRCEKAGWTPNDRLLGGVGDLQPLVEEGSNVSFLSG